MRLRDLEGKRVIVLGTGREGRAAAEALAPVVASFAASDDRDGESAVAWRERWGTAAEVWVAADPRDIARDFDVAVKSPGMSPLHPLVAFLANAGVPITSGSDLWMSEHASTTTGVTGSKGKSTTSSLIAHLSAAAGVDTVLGGNIGTPLLALAPADRTVVELSSYQCQSLSTSPDVAVLTSLFAEHLDWHGSEEQYFADKLNLVGHGARVVIANAEDETLVAALARLHPALEVQWVGGANEYAVRDGFIVRGEERVLATADLPLLGRHNALNAAIALAAADAGGARIDAAIAATALASFAPLEHRLEPIVDASGLTFINDSLSTSPFAAIEALKAFDSPDVVLLAGGQDRGVDYAPLAAHLAAHPIAAVVGLPPSGPRILAEISGVHTEVAVDMLDAVTRARALVPAGGTVLLSPAAPSYGIYKDFADRAADFRRAIEATTSY